MNMEYYSQYGQDTIFKQFFDQKKIEKGFFLDVGSVDGVYISNTLLLENAGWDGICVEAHPSFFQFLVANRKCKCYSLAAGDKDSETCDFYAYHRASYSSLDSDVWLGKGLPENVNGVINGKISIPMKKIDTILEENGVTNLDFVTIDVDGSEKKTLGGFTLNRWLPTLLMLEHTVVGHNYIDRYASNYGYHKARTIGSDTIYCRHESDVQIIRSLKVIGKQTKIIHPSDKYFGNE